MRMSGMVQVALALSFVSVLPFMAGCGGEADDSSESEASRSLESTQATAESAQQSASKAAHQDTSQKEPALVAVAIAERDPKVRLGIRLFFENRLSNPGANLATSCRTCHAPPEVNGGATLYTDTVARSVMPSTRKGSKRETLRNTPTLLDAGLRKSFMADGRYDSLETLIAEKLLSENMGWMADDAERARNEVHALMLNDMGEDSLAEGSYIEQFKAVKGVDLESLAQDEVIAEVIASLLDYIDSLRTSRTSAYDAITFLNRLNEGLSGEGDTPQALSGRILGRIANQEGRVLIRFPNIYNEEAYQGMKTFVRVVPTVSSSTFEPEENVGNCIACHVPPKFTDGKFHNIGVTQFEYDSVHGAGSFLRKGFREPSENTQARVLATDSESVDLGRFNQDKDQASIGAIQTPPLRFVEKTGPYMHNGQYGTLEDVIRAHMKAAEMAKDGSLRNADPELKKMNISEADIPNLVAFLHTLNEVPEEEYRDYRITDVRIRQDPLGEQDYDN